MLRVVAVVRGELVPLIKSLGIANVVAVEDRESAEAALDELLRVGDVAVILVQGSILRGLRVPAEVHGKVYPVIVEFPDNPDDLRVSARDYYRDLIRKFIGYEIHLG